MASKPNIFTRVPPPDPKFAGVINDLYDKLAQLTPVAPSAVLTPTPIPTPVAPVVPASSSSGNSGGGSKISYAFTDIPDLASVPSNNPTTGAPYAVDGVVVQVNKELWRYSGAPTYQWQLAATATQLITDTHLNRVANYPPASYPNAYFLESDTLILLESNSLTWRTIAGEVQDTHANRLTTWPSVQYSVSTPFYETDRTVTYMVQNAAGTVNTSGTAVTWATGNHFINTGTGFNAAQWPSGTPIVINAVTYTISVVNSATSLTLTTSAGVQTGVNYSVASGRWVYLSGEYSAALASLPGDLGECDTTLASTKVAIGFLFYENVVYAHQLQWNVSAWQRGPHDEEHSDTFHEFGAVPTDIGWQVCDGSSVNYLKYDGTTVSRIVPNSNGTAAYAKGGGTYSATITAATAPTIGGQTEDTTIGFTPAAAATVSTGTAMAGITQAVVTALTSGGGGGSLGTDPHHHALTAADAPITLPGDPIPNFSVIRMYRR